MTQAHNIACTCNTCDIYTQLKLCIWESKLRQHTDLFCVNGLAKFSRNGTYGEGGSVAAGGWKGNNDHWQCSLTS